MKLSEIQELVVGDRIQSKDSRGFCRVFEVCGFVCDDGVLQDEATSGVEVKVFDVKHPSEEYDLDYAYLLQDRFSLVKRVTLCLVDRLRGMVFKGGLLKNTKGVFNQHMVGAFSEGEFILDSISSLYVYGYPVGKFMDPAYRMQFNPLEVRFYFDGQEWDDSVPTQPLLSVIKQVSKDMESQ